MLADIVEGLLRRVTTECLASRRPKLQFWLSGYLASRAAAPLVRRGAAQCRVDASAPAPRNRASSAMSQPIR